MGTLRSEQGSSFSQEGMNAFGVFSPNKTELLHFTPLCVVRTWWLSTAPWWQLKGCSWGEQRIHQRWVSPVEGQKVRTPVWNLRVWRPPSIQAAAMTDNDFSIVSQPAVQRAKKEAVSASSRMLEASVLSLSPYTSFFLFFLNVAVSVLCCKLSDTQVTTGSWERFAAAGDGSVPRRGVKPRTLF